MCTLPTMGSSLTIYLNMKQAFLTMRLRRPAPLARDALALAPSALLHDRGRNGELQSKMGNSGRCRRQAAGMQHPRGSLLLRGRGAQGGCSHRTATHQPLRSPPHTGCTRMFKRRGPNPAPTCLNCVVQTLVRIPPLSHQSLWGNGLTMPQCSPLSGRGPPEPLLRKVQSCHLMGCTLLWLGLTAKGGVTLHVLLKLRFAKSFHSAGRTWLAESLVN